MNKNVFGMIMFAAGAAVGSVVTWKVVKTKYEKIAQEEIDSVKETFNLKKLEAKGGEEVATKAEADVEEAEPDPRPHYQNPDLFEYYNKILGEGYTSDVPESAKEEKGGSNVGLKPHVISPDEFGELEDEGYDKVKLAWYADGVLADDRGNVVENVDETIGMDNLKRMGEYEDDAVHIRNDHLKIDYEILLSLRKYEETNFDYPPDDDDPYQGDDE